MIFSKQVISFLYRQGKPEVLTAMELVTKDFWQFFVPFNATAPFPDTMPCRKKACILLMLLYLTFFNSGGVQEFQKTYAFTSWAGSTVTFRH